MTTITEENADHNLDYFSWKKWRSDYLWL